MGAYKVEKIFDKPEICADCNEDLEQLFLFCRSCDEYICYNCLPNHMDHDYLPCTTIEDNKTKALNVGVGGYGPPMDIWPAIGIDSFTSNYNSKCAHAENYFEKNNITFNCKNCEKWVCLECSKDHLDHGLMLHVGFNNGKELRQIDPNLYNSENQLLLSAKANKIDDKHINVELEVNNSNDVPLYDLRIMYTWNGLDHDNWDNTNLETIDNQNYFCNEIFKLEIIPPNETIKMGYELTFSDIPDNNLSPIITIIRSRDVFLGNGVVIKKSKFRTN